MLVKYVRKIQISISAVCLADGLMRVDPVLQAAISAWLSGHLTVCTDGQCVISI